MLLKDAVDLSAVKRVLVIKLRHHGDVLLTSPVFSVLKNHAPHLELDALVYKDTQEMLSGHPAIDTIFTIDRAWKTHGPLVRMRHEWRLLQDLRARGYGLIVHLTENPRGAVLARLLGARYSVARAYPSKRGRLWRRSFTHLYPVPARPRHTVEIHLDALRRIGIYPNADERRLVLAVDPAEKSSVDELLRQHGIGAEGFIHVHPTSRWLFKCWKAEKYADMINALHKAGEKIIVTAAPDKHEMDFVERVIAKIDNPVVNLAGRLGLKQLAALCSQAKCFVGVDSVPMHIAAAVQTPVVVLFGPSGDLEWGPWQAKSRVITSDHACRPCGQDGCGGGKVSECLTDIPMEAVLAAVQEMISAT